MTDNLHFKIKFYKIRNKIDISQELSIEEQFEAVDKSIDVIEVLTHFIATSNPYYKIDADTNGIFREVFKEVIDSFISSARDGISEIENHRKRLENSLSEIKIGIA